MRIRVRRGRIVVRGSLTGWCFDALPIVLFAAAWWFWVPGGTLMPLKALGPVAGVAFGLWWLVGARLVVDPQADRVTYVGLLSRSVSLGEVVGVNVAGRLQMRQNVPCLLLRTTGRSIKCRAVSALLTSRVHQTARVLQRALASVTPGRPITQDEVKRWKFAVRPDRPAQRGLPD